MKNIKAICDSFKITTGKACEIFGVTAEELQRIYNDEEDLDSKALYELIKVTQVSIDYIMEGKVSNANDRLVANYVSVTNKSMLIKKRIEELIFYLGSEGIDSSNYEFDILKLFNKEIDEVDGLMLLKLNDYKLYELLKKRYLMKKFSVRTNDKVIYISDWHELINYYLVNYLFDKTITDPKFIQELSVPNDYLLEAYRNGSLKWNSRAILHLIAIGSVLYYNATDGNKIDILQTKLLKDYCLNHIDE